jgi:pterin-4a-carbinolamine dehydratase
MTQQKLRTLVSYNQETGIFVLLRTGKELGTQAKSLYMQTSLEKKQFYLHRLAFLYMTGEMPEEVDHINHIRNDNRWLNLENSTHRMNAKNRPISTRNTTGVVGVNLHNKTGLWRARTTVNGITETTYHKEFNEAVQARIEAKTKLDFHKNHH